MATPEFISVYSNPDAHQDFLCAANDGQFEGQHFDRKQAGESNGSTPLSKSGLNSLRDHVERTISGFANATGGLLVIGVSKKGEVIGVDHLTDDQKTSLLDFSNLRGAHPQGKLHTLQVGSDTREIAIVKVETDDRTYCWRAKDDAAWQRRGTQTVQLKGLELEQLKRDRKVVEFERMRADDFDEGDIDVAVLREFTKSKQYGRDAKPIDVLRDAGALNGKTQHREWTNAGALFFTSNPRRIFAHGYVRLLRFDCPYEDEDERPTPTFERNFDGPLTKQIRDLRTFVSDTGFFKSFEVRAADGGFVSEPEYPFIAIDEAIVNAIAHRDYAIQLPIFCEKYEDAFVVKSPGKLQQQFETPPEFKLTEVVLESRLRNPRLMDWLREMKDAKGAAFVKAIREGTRRMRDEMEQLGLPAPVFINRPAETILLLRNDIKRRTAKPTGLAASEDISSSEFANLYKLNGFDGSGARPRENENRRLFLTALRDKLEATGWVVDRFDKGRIIAHPRGAQEPLPDSLRSIVRLLPAYELSVRSYFGNAYLAVDFSLQVQSILKLSDTIDKFALQELVGLRAFAMDGEILIRGRILTIDGGLAEIRQFDTNETFTATVAKVFPALQRAQLDRLVREAAPGFDFARAIKSAALALKSGAARDRARRIGSVVETMARTIFPLETAEFRVTLDERPLALLDDGDGRRALRAQTVREPEVEFSQHRSTPNIREGITSYGAYGDEPKNVDLIAVVEPGFEQPMRDLVARLQTGKFKYKGSERTFSTRLRLAQVSTAQGIRVDEECRRLIDAYPEWRANPQLQRMFLVHTPEENFALDDVTSPYYQAKRLLLEAGVPCQMIDTPTLRNADYKDLNLALNVVAKTGVTPWVLPESIPDADFFVGLSYTSSRMADSNDRVLGFANVFNQYGRWEFYSGGNEAVPYDERHRHYEELVAKTLERLPLSETPTICFHYSARYGRADREAILSGARRVRPNGRFVFIWINTHHPVRLFDETPGTDGSLARGRFVVGAPNQIYLSTTGYNQYRKSIGTPQALEINVYEEFRQGTSPPAIDHKALARQILSLTKLNWASTDALCGEPITTKYAKDIAYLTAAFRRQQLGTFRLHEVLERTPWFI